MSMYEAHVPASEQKMNQLCDAIERLARTANISRDDAIDRATSAVTLMINTAYRANGLSTAGKGLWSALTGKPITSNGLVPTNK